MSYVVSSQVHDCFLSVRSQPFHGKLWGMIAHLAGIVFSVHEKSIIVDVHGVGYRVATLASLRRRVAAGSAIKLFIHHHTTSDSQDLYGFAETQDLEFFKLLLTVPSVGPRTAINILDIAPPTTLAQAVAERDTILLTKVSGVGRKTAERIVIELRGKIEAPTRTALSGAVQQQTVDALVSIGYSATQAREVVGNLPKEVTTVEQAVREALRERS